MSKKEVKLVRVEGKDLVPGLYYYDMDSDPKIKLKFSHLTKDTIYFHKSKTSRYGIDHTGRVPFPLDGNIFYRK